MYPLIPVFCTIMQNDGAEDANSASPEDPDIVSTTVPGRDASKCCYISLHEETSLSSTLNGHTLQYSEISRIKSKHVSYFSKSCM